MKSFDLITIGDSTIDLFAKVDEAKVECDMNHENCTIAFPYAGKVPVEEIHSSVAGNAPNVAIGATKLGMATSILTQIGDDVNADLIINTLAKEGVDTSFCAKNKGRPTNVHPIIVYKGERTIFSYHENYNYEIQDWEAPKFIYYSSISENFEDFQNSLVEYIKKNPNTILAMNPGTLQLKAGVEKLKNILEHTDILFVNKEEAKLLTGRKIGTVDMLELHKGLSNLGVKLSVITDSKYGSSAYDGNEQVRAGVFEIDGSSIADKTGAGDAFASGFLGGIFHGKAMETALKWGSINAANVMLEIGSIKGLQTKEAIVEKLKEGKFIKIEK